VRKKPARDLDVVVKVLKDVRAVDYVPGPSQILPSGLKNGSEIAIRLASPFDGSGNIVATVQAGCGVVLMPDWKSIAKCASHVKN